MKRFFKDLTPPVLLRLYAAVRGRRPRPDRLQEEMREAHERRNRNAADDEIVLREGLTLRIHPESRAAMEAFCFGSPAMVAEMDCFLERTRGQERLLDVGALHGVFSLVFCAAGTRHAIAVDPSAIAFARLLYNVHRSRLEELVVPVECALSDARGMLRMHYEWEHAVAAGTGGSERRAGERGGFSVEKRTGDDLCRTLGFEPDVVKIDVEGHEVKVLRGLHETFRRHRPLVFLELHPSRIREEGDSVEEIARLLTSLAYEAAFVDGQPVSFAELAALRVDARLVCVSAG